MREITVGKIRRSLKRFEDFAGDLARSDMNTFADRLNMLIDYCKTDPVTLVIHEQLINMPSVNFDSWHKDVISTMGGMAGSGDLTFPTELEKRMALMYQLLDKVNNGEIDIIDFSHNFFAIGDNSIDSIIFAFNEAIIEPLARELAYRIEDLEEEMPEDNKETFPLANIQIIHNAGNVVQQAASGNNISQNANIESRNELSQLFDDLRQELRNVINEESKIDDALQIVQTSQDLANNAVNCSVMRDVSHKNIYGNRRTSS